MIMKTSQNHYHKALGLSLLFIAAALLITGISIAQEPLSINQILEMKEAGVGDDIIVERIETSKTTMNLTVKEIISLRRKGLSDRIIRALLEIKDGETVPTPTSEITSPSPTPEIERVVEEGVHPEKTDKNAISFPVEINKSSSEASKIFKITSTPSQSDITIDGVKRGVTPYYTNLELGGAHTIIISKKFFKELKMVIDLEQETIQDLHVDLELLHPVVELEWKFPKNEAFMKHLRWAIQNCTNSSGMNWVELFSESEEKDGNKAYLMVSPEENNFLDRKACLNCFLWLKPRDFQTTQGGSQNEADIRCTISDIPLSTTEITKLTVELVPDNRYPQGIRIVLRSSGSRLFRIPNPSYEDPFFY